MTLTTIIMGNVELDYVITDKEVTISSGKEVKGSDTFPIFVPAYKTINTDLLYQKALGVNLDSESFYIVIGISMNQQIQHMLRRDFWET